MHFTGGDVQLEMVKCAGGAEVLDQARDRYCIRHGSRYTYVSVCCE